MDTIADIQVDSLGFRRRNIRPMEFSKKEVDLAA
jgi:hypothetical protein